MDVGYLDVGYLDAPYLDALYFDALYLADGGTPRKRARAGTTVAVDIEGPYLRPN